MAAGGVVAEFSDAKANIYHEMSALDFEGAYDEHSPTSDPFERISRGSSAVCFDMNDPNSIAVDMQSDFPLLASPPDQQRAANMEAIDSVTDRARKDESTSNQDDNCITPGQSDHDTAEPEDMSVPTCDQDTTPSCTDCQIYDEIQPVDVEISLNEEEQETLAPQSSSVCESVSGPKVDEGQEDLAAPPLFSSDNQPDALEELRQQLRMAQLERDSALRELSECRRQEFRGEAPAPDFAAPEQFTGDAGLMAEYEQMQQLLLESVERETTFMDQIDSLRRALAALAPDRFQAHEDAISVISGACEVIDATADALQMRAMEVQRLQEALAALLTKYSGMTDALASMSEQVNEKQGALERSTAILADMDSMLARRPGAVSQTEELPPIPALISAAETDREAAAARVALVWQQRCTMLTAENAVLARRLASAEMGQFPATSVDDIVASLRAQGPLSLADITAAHLSSQASTLRPQGPRPPRARPLPLAAAVRSATFQSGLTATYIKGDLWSIDGHKVHVQMDGSDLYVITQGGKVAFQSWAAALRSRPTQPQSPPVEQHRSVQDQLAQYVAEFKARGVNLDVVHVNRDAFIINGVYVVLLVNRLGSLGVMEGGGHFVPFTLWMKKHATALSAYMSSQQEINQSTGILLRLCRSFLPYK